jgi:hypothetical protein
MGTDSGLTLYNRGSVSPEVDKWITPGYLCRSYAPRIGLYRNNLNDFSTNARTLLLLLLSFIYNPLGKGA